MEMFQLRRADDVAQAVNAAAYAEDRQGAPVRFLAGGTTLIDLMKLDVERPGMVVDINRLPLDRIEPTPEGGVRIGATVRNADLAHDPVIRERYPVLSQALLSGASAQLRNMATTGGNLLQRTRCVYFRDVAMPCNKREPGSGCPAIGGYNRNLAVLGTSDACIASNPSDMNVALMALGAAIEIQGADGARTVGIDDFFLLPGDTPQRETVLAPGELITHVTLPPLPAGTRSHYLKLRDRASYEFALASAAVVVTMANGSIRTARVAMGGIGTRPWRVPSAELLLAGGAPSAAVFEAAARELLRDARPQSENAFKIELARRCLVHALNTVTATD
ncbi:FAD-binding molybdopterin dehydrogenase [Pigmentiphaga sp. NML080357]|uniref:FAD binding domain-containing protein n=1 Tax=Pigmentiphaga sp. NML080357 TaxID=2008675 RepID=UPI000B41FEDB|nr:xanthine dehydrogenase family protein subunit M [Pigmentiphaga sp. NML080357]OVZ55021.1 FAD-binding molybdopterin dehydrogenase [Pigmentiphaga sp. NML080357]